MDAQSPDRVAVVINEDSATSRQIGEHYVGRRAIPPGNVIRVRGTSEERITRSEYSAAIEGPVAKALAERNLYDRIDFLVLTKGVPLVIDGSQGATGTAASVDSELTLLYRRLAGGQAPATGRIENPYYAGPRSVSTPRPFRRAEHDIYLVTRLDGYSVDEVTALIDRCAVAGPAGDINLMPLALPRGAVADGWFDETTKAIASTPTSGVQIRTAPPAGTSTATVGYYSWGSNDPRLRQRRTGLRFAPGAIGATLAGPDARTFTPPPDTWTPSATADRRLWYAGSSHSLIGDLIREGITGVAGQTGETDLGSAVRPQLLFPGYLSGLTLAEAFYRAIPYLSSHTVVIGDPLCRPFARDDQANDSDNDRIDERTGLPAHFSRRRLEAAAAATKGVPPDVLPTLIRAEHELRKGDKEAARRLLEEATAAAPDVVSAQILLAELYQGTDDHRQAVERYRQILKVQPRNVVALNNLAYALAVHERGFDEALSLATRAVTLNPHEATVLDTLGWIHHLRGEHADALRYLDDAVKRSPAAPEIRLHAAVASAAAGRYDAARSHLAELLRQHPDHAGKPEVIELKRKLDSVK